MRFSGGFLAGFWYIDKITGNSSADLIAHRSKRAGITSDFVYFSKTCRKPVAGGFPEVSGQSVIDGPHGTWIGHKCLKNQLKSFEL